MSRIDGVILAGGLSLRMGYPKQKLRLGGQPLLERVALVLNEGLKPGKNSSIFVSGEPDTQTPSWVSWVPDRFGRAGPLGGIASVAIASEAEWLVIIPVDMPFLTSKVIRALIDHRGEEELTSFEGEFPLILKNSLRVKEELLNKLNDRDQKFRSIQKFREVLSHKTLRIPDDWKNLFLNMNTPTDLESALKRLSNPLR